MSKRLLIRFNAREKSTKEKAQEMFAFGVSGDYETRIVPSHFRPLAVDERPSAVDVTRWAVRAQKSCVIETNSHLDDNVESFHSALVHAPNTLSGLLITPLFLDVNPFETRLNVGSPPAP